MRADRLTAANLLSLGSRRRIPLQEGDRVLLLEGRSRGRAFTATATLGDVSRKDADVDGRTHWTLTAHVQRDLEFEPRPLEVLAYSLVQVRNASRPSGYFRLPYTRIRERDFETIEHGRIHWARTAFGLHTSELPRGAAQAFLRSLAATHPSLLSGGDYRQLWQCLEEFIRSEYIAAHTLLCAIRERCRVLRERGVDVPFESLSLLDDDTPVRRPDSLSSQLTRLEALVVALEPRGADRRRLFSELERRIEQTESGVAPHDDVFRDRPWLSMLNL